MKSIDLIRRVLHEDAGAGDPTSEVLFGPKVRAAAEIRAKAKGVLAGIRVAEAVFRATDPDVRFRATACDGDRVRQGRVVARLEGRARSLLKGERLALNYICRLSGIATLTHAFVGRIKGTGVLLRHTRKTTPLLRDNELAAVRAGGGSIHRRSLGDGVLVKDNHLAILGDPALLAPAIRRWRERGFDPMVEVTDERQARAALGAGARSLLIDNAKTRVVRRVVAIARSGEFGHVFLEASGGVTLEDVRRIARTGVDAISVGRITHSAPALDFSLEILPPSPARA
ncbi:MAG: carboxylating nicotinate-nucleotide diphosphorylase [Planctomycetota bacterium]